MMTTFVAMLRAVNVSGRNKIAMADLRRALGGLGLAGVETYLQTGNVVFGAGTDDPLEQAVAIHEQIRREFGHDVRVLVLTAAELAQVAAANPFVARAASASHAVDEKWLHATFLCTPVEEAVFGGLDLPARDDEEAVLAVGISVSSKGDAGPAGRVVYLSLPHGYGRTKLSNAYFERTLGTPATTRNWRTVMALVAISARR
jgi:uncharacterized protein (DUF1697 family)